MRIMSLTSVNYNQKTSSQAFGITPRKGIRISKILAKKANIVKPQTSKHITISSVPLGRGPQDAMDSYVSTTDFKALEKELSKVKPVDRARYIEDAM